MRKLDFCVVRLGFLSSGSKIRLLYILVGAGLPPFFVQVVGGFLAPLISLPRVMEAAGMTDDQGNADDLIDIELAAAAATGQLWYEIQYPPVLLKRYNVLG